ncbi:hypothetical protein Rhopal_001362-T1 [Rhodotorula paludigena]|uniref:F-box domain-containing protein n=1 Tax=Rhodotorula paludigena TaxID=86838 RepID=A0AAV5G765_9BASI|nr:hypothetical protein Rhopal_001362-T1 [Rhodotorula paludigena]
MSSPAPGKPRATLDSLPLEIKARIVELCDEQDERFEAMMDETARRARYVDSAHLDVLVAQCRTTNLPSVSALFRVSKAWSDLAAPYRFKVLKLSRTHNVTFRCLIAYSRARHFRQLVLDKPAGPAGDLVFLASILALSFEKVQHIVVKQSVIPVLQLTSLSNGHVRLWDQRGFCAMNLRRLLRVATLLDLSVAECGTITEFLKHSLVLRELTVDLAELSDAPDHLAHILAAAPSVTKLRLVTPAGFSFNMTKPSAPPQTWPSLRSLEIEGPLSGDGIASFALHFAASLTSLVIHTLEDDPDAVVPLFKSEKLPVLAHLTLRTTTDCAYDIAWCMLGTLEPKHVPALTTLAVNFEDHGDALAADSDDKRLLEQIETFAKASRTLRKVTLFDTLSTVMSVQQAYFAQWAARLNLRVCLDPHDSQPEWPVLRAREYQQNRAPNEEMEQSERDALTTGVDRTTQFLYEWVGRAKYLGDDVELARIAESLCAVELERAAMLT